MNTQLDSKPATACPGCGALLQPIEGTTHRYMTSSPACWDKFGCLLALEYSDPLLLPTHRLSVDTYAAQHPGDSSRHAIQSVGLHLARLMIQLESPLTPREANDVMVRLGPRKAALKVLEPPEAFQMTIADVFSFAGKLGHSEAVRAWAESAWHDWHRHHAYIRNWVAD